MKGSKLSMMKEVKIRVIVIFNRIGKPCIENLACTRDHFPTVDFHPTIECMTTAFSCNQRNYLRCRYLNVGYHLVKRGRLTIISTSSRMMQLISLAPAPMRAFADIETLGPICIWIAYKKIKPSLTIDML